MIERAEDAHLALEARESVASAAARVVAGEDLNGDPLTPYAVNAFEDACARRGRDLAENLVAAEEARAHRQCLRLGRVLRERAAQGCELVLGLDACLRQAEPVEGGEENGERGAPLRAPFADLLQRTNRGVDLAVPQEQRAERNVELVPCRVLAHLRLEHARGADDVSVCLEECRGLDGVAAALVGTRGRTAFANALEQARGPEVIAAALEVERDALGLNGVVDQRGERALGGFVVLALEGERQRASEVAAAERLLGGASKLACALEERARSRRVTA